MTAATAFLLGLIVGEAVALASVAYARHAIRTARCAAETDEGTTDDPPPPIERRTTITMVPRITPAQVADLSPIDFAAVIGESGDPTVLLPVVLDGNLAGVIDLDASGQRAARRTYLYDRPPPTPPAD